MEAGKVRELFRRAVAAVFSPARNPWAPWVVRMGGGATQGIKVAHHKVRRDAVGHQGVIATVGGDDVVPRSGVGAQRGGQGHGPHHITDALVIGHDKTFFFREHKRPGEDRENP